MSGTSTRPWIAWRLDSEPGWESSQVGRLTSCIQQARSEGRFARWFYLWYHDDRLHLRIRVRPKASQDVTKLAAELQDLISSADPHVRLRAQVYDRALLSFGETMESVLAELLHEATSALAADLLSHHGRTIGHGTRWLLAAAATAVIVRKSIAPAEAAGFFTEWIDFAQRTIHRVGDDPQLIPAVGREVRLQTLQAALPRVDAALAASGSLHKIQLLLQRLRRRGVRGRFAALHALHLFCNEMGLSIQREYVLANDLRSQWMEQAHEPEGITA